MKKDINDEKDNIRKELDNLAGGIDQRIAQSVADQQAARELARITGGKPTIILPSPVRSEIAFSIELDGDDEYWL